VHVWRCARVRPSDRRDVGQPLRRWPKGRRCSRSWPAAQSPAYVRDQVGHSSTRLTADGWTPDVSRRETRGDGRQDPLAFVLSRGSDRPGQHEPARVLPGPAGRCVGVRLHPAPGEPLPARRAEVGHASGRGAGAMAVEVSSGRRERYRLAAPTSRRCEPPASLVPHRVDAIEGYARRTGKPSEDSGAGART